jgi:cytidylate kinase
MKHHDSIEELNRLLKVRLQESQLPEKQERPRPRPVVTITREPGSGGERIAQRLCSELDLRHYDWELVEQIAKDEHVSAQLVSTLEKYPPGAFEDYLAEFGEHRLTSDKYVARVKTILLAIAVTGNAVIVGRGSNFFLPADKKLGLCFVAPLDLRVKNIMNESGLTEKKAREQVSKLEAGHSKLVKKYFQTDIRDPSQYHLVINTALVKPDTIVQLVKTMLKEKGE